MNEPFQVTTEVFEGPLELLLALIEKRKLFINDISLAQVADDFLAYIQKHPEFPIAQTAQFILIGSTLLLIKSKSLLPILILTEEEQESIEDLETRLKLYERYRALSLGLRPLFNVRRLFSPRAKRRRDPVFSPDTSMTVPTLHAAMLRVISALPEQKPTLTSTTIRKIVSLEEMIERLTDRVQSGVRTSFRDFASQQSKQEKVNMVVSFLALLELVKQGVVRVEQEAHFDDIIIEHDRLGVPRYL